MCIVLSYDINKGKGEAFPLKRGEGGYNLVVYYQGDGPQRGEDLPVHRGEGG